MSKKPNVLPPAIAGAIPAISTLVGRPQLTIVCRSFPPLAKRTFSQCSILSLDVCSFGDTELCNIEKVMNGIIE